MDIRGTEFQCRVWQALLTIPYGETGSYDEIARMIGEPRDIQGGANACAASRLSALLYQLPVVRVAGGTIPPGESITIFTILGGTALLSAAGLSSRKGELHSRSHVDSGPSSTGESQK